MATKPTSLPRWGTNPPPAPPTTIVEPSEGEKDLAWQPGNPRREYMNWLQNLTYQWLEWLDSNGFRLDDLFEDFIHPNTSKTSPPATGAGLNGTTGFALGYIQGERAVAADAAKVYLPNEDRYFDLNKAGGFTETAVAAMAGAPAVPADHLRCWKVRTDGSDRTEVEFLAQNEIRFVELFHAMTSIVLGNGQTGSAAAFLVPRVIAKFSASASERMLLHEFSATNYPTELANGNHAIRLYILGSGDDPEFELVIGAAWNNGTSMWDTDPKTGCGTIAISRIRYSVGDGIKFETTNSDIVGTSFADSAWEQHVLDTTQTKQLPVSGGIKAGSNAFSLRETIEVPRYEGLETGHATRQLHAKVGNSGRIYLLPPGGTGLNGADYGMEHVSNAEYIWTGATYEWSRIQTGEPSYLIANGTAGRRVYVREAGQADTWDNTSSLTPATGWTLIEHSGILSDNVKSFLGPETMIVPFGSVDASFPATSGNNSGAMPVGVLKSGVAGVLELVHPLNLPDLATITGAEVRFESVSGGVGANSCTVDLVRCSRALARESLNSGGWTSVPNNGAPQDVAVTIDQNTLVDLLTYRYFLRVHAFSVVQFHCTSVKVDYTIRGNLGPWR